MWWTMEKGSVNTKCRHQDGYLGRGLIMTKSGQAMGYQGRRKQGDQQRGDPAGGEMTGRPHSWPAHDAKQKGRKIQMGKKNLQRPRRRDPTRSWQGAGATNRRPFDRTTRQKTRRKKNKKRNHSLHLTKYTTGTTEGIMSVHDPSGRNNLQSSNKRKPSAGTSSRTSGEIG